MNRQEFAYGIAMLATTLGLDIDDKRDSDRLDLYFTLLKDIPAQDFQQGVVWLLNDRVYPTLPTPAELRKAAQSGGNGVDVQTRAMRAWQAVCGAFKLGSYRTITFSDPLVNAAVRAVGGWVELCECDSEECRIRENRFRQHYVALYHAGAHAEQCRPLQGIIGQQNSRDGFQERIPEPQRIECGLPPLPAGLIRGTASNLESSEPNPAARIVAERLKIESKVSNP